MARQGPCTHCLSAATWPRLRSQEMVWFPPFLALCLDRLLNPTLLFLPPGLPSNAFLMRSSANPGHRAMCQIAQGCWGHPSTALHLAHCAGQQSRGGQGVLWQGPASHQLQKGFVGHVKEWKMLVNTQEAIILRRMITTSLIPSLTVSRKNTVNISPCRSKRTLFIPLGVFHCQSAHRDHSCPMKAELPVLTEQMHDHSQPMHLQALSSIFLHLK